MKVMNVEIAIIALLVVSIALIAFSYFQREPIKEVEQELETLQLSAMQEIYKLKKKMTVLEEELLDSNVVVRRPNAGISQHIAKHLALLYLLHLLRYSASLPKVFRYPDGVLQGYL